MTQDIQRIVAGLSEAQIKALIDAATLLDYFAGEGLGMMPTERMGEALHADDAVWSIALAFDFDLAASDWNFADAARAYLEEQNRA